MESLVLFILRAHSGQILSSKLPCHLLEVLPQRDMPHVLRASVVGTVVHLHDSGSPQVHLRKVALSGTGLRARSYPDLPSELLHYKDPLVLVPMASFCTRPGTH